MDEFIVSQMKGFVVYDQETLEQILSAFNEHFGITVSYINLRWHVNRKKLRDRVNGIIDKMENKKRRCNDSNLPRSMSNLSVEDNAQG